MSSEVPIPINIIDLVQDDIVILETMVTVTHK